MDDEVQRLVDFLKSPVQSPCLGHGSREAIEKPALIGTQLVQLCVDELDHDLVRDEGAILHLLGSPLSDSCALRDVLAQEVTARDGVDLKVVLDPAGLCSLAGALRECGIGIGARPEAAC